MTSERAAWLNGFLVCVFFVAGCDGDNSATAKGAVQFDGIPVAEGSINFVPVDGKTKTAWGSIKDGKYDTRVPVGLMKVFINYPEVVDKKKAYDTPDSPTRPVYAETLPAKYSDRERTELQLDVKPGTNVKDWDLKSK
jgi:hypothetical protein